MAELAPEWKLWMKTPQEMLWNWVVLLNLFHLVLACQSFQQIMQLISCLARDRQICTRKKHNTTTQMWSISSSNSYFFKCSFAQIMQELENEGKVPHAVYVWHVLNFLFIICIIIFLKATMLANGQDLLV